MKNMKNKWSLKKEEEETITDANKFNEWVNRQETKINKELFENYFSFQTPSALLKDLYKTNDKKKNRLSVSVINSGLKDIKKKLKKCLKKKEKIKSQIR